jgi:hypothetical protein
VGLRTAGELVLTFDEMGVEVDEELFTKTFLDFSDFSDFSIFG